MSNGSPSDRPWEEAQYRLHRAVDRLEAAVAARRTSDDTPAQESVDADNARRRQTHDVLAQRLDTIIARVRAMVEERA